MLNRIFYYGLLLPVSKLPFPVLYMLSDFLYLVMYKLGNYRRKVVSSNINSSFPEKTPKERLKIEQDFYHHFFDIVVESIKTFSLSESEIRKRLKILNPEITNSFYEQGKSIIGVGGHNGNWELYATACSLNFKHQASAFYKALNNEYFDKKLRKNRSRFGLKMVPTSEKHKFFQPDKNMCYIFGIDQCPRLSQKPIYLNFLNRESAVQYGAEKFARTHDLPVFFGNIFKVKRGYYEVRYDIVCEDPSAMKEGEIMEKSTRMLEKCIREQPSNYLWTHKRWKRTREDFERIQNARTA